jgi:putative variant cofactor biosynthesis B12-binding/radical SAM domain protein 1
MNVHDAPWKALKTLIEDNDPQIAALSFRNMDPLAGQDSSYLSSLVTATRLVKQTAPDCRIIVGGPGFSLFARDLMAIVPDIDIGLVGEGEIQFSKLVKALCRPGEVPGSVWRQNGKIVLTRPGAKLDMAELPALSTSTFDPAVYLQRNAYVASMGIEGKRGCDLTCAYCVYPQLGGAKLRLRPPEHIVAEIESLHKSNGVNLFHFTDSVVNRPPDHFESVCRLLRRRRLDVQWTGFFRENHLTSEQLGLALDAGLAAVYLSGDALTEQGLKLLNKQMCIDDLLQAARTTARHKVLTVCHFMANLPGETPNHWADARATLETLLSIHAPAGNLGAVIFNNIRLYPGAALTRHLIRQGVLPTDANLVYPTYYNPCRGAHVKHEMETLCHTAGVFSSLGIDSLAPVQERAVL